VPSSGPLVCRSPWSGLGPALAYRIAALRVAVFVVEQRCPYLDLDGRDLEPGAEQRWVAGPDGEVLAALRALDEGDGATRIGRVVTDPRHRSEGLAARLIESVLADRPGPFVLDAQAHLQEYYERFGFVVAGEPFVEDGIPHVPMRRPAAPRCPPQTAEEGPQTAEEDPQRAEEDSGRPKK
jgi:ElaA protein